jgi:ABC-type polysaccharide/polyol phosphate transport system ATPase subunit
MSDTVITVEHLSKRYLVGHRVGQRERYTSLRDVIGREARNFARKAVDFARGRQIIQGDEVEEFWALKDLSFEVKQGEVVGIIGRNGAGKSTLLKILSRITEPTEGRVRLRGRVASLLEVGTGFHPELTGRENIFLNGAILGMRRADIMRKFDEIVAFAGTERFLDVPIKRYSSGMYVRLAFALAAHIEPDILIVDEVLAVGDHEFQQKCLGKMHDVASQEGRTVLLVSHQLAAIGEMAKRALLLDAGRILVDGPVATAVSTYLSKGASAPIYTCPAEKGSPVPHVRSVQVFTSEPGGAHEFGKPLTIELWISHDTPMARGHISIQIINQYQQPVIDTFPDFSIGTKSGETHLVCHFPMLRLNVGRFYLRTWLSEPPGAEHYEALDGICLFEVVRTDKQVLWGWRPEVCAYHEDCTWTTVASNVNADGSRT